MHVIRPIPHVLMLEIRRVA